MSQPVEGDVAREEELTAAEEEFETGEAVPGSSEFLLERDPQLYLAKNPDRIESGLKLYENDGVQVLEFEAGGRHVYPRHRQDGAFLVLKLKVSCGYDRVVGQLVEPGNRVRGIIFCRAMSEGLRLACASIKDVELFEDQLSVTMTKVPALELNGIR